ncbi:endothelin-converting enzyme 1-like [Stegodyphus dumicola]|uniref:endothelin-converting enzyme 1-like n=1 Tax=Stegodyphus dumicola TaxID=202533 RepID=UPI0015B365F9|nr:endothelin-converting enzyme 1-like [Stegodyphus dumicola]
MRNRDILLPLLNGSETCKTPSCVKAAADILSFTDETVDPCDDFYKFSCGSWIKRQDHDGQQALKSLGNVTKHILRVILERKLDGDQCDFIRQMKTFYDSCTNEKSIKETGIKSLMEILEELGGWPVIEGENWNSSFFNWIDVRSRLPEVDAKDNLLTLSVVADPRNNSFQILQMNKMPWWELENGFLNNGPDHYETVKYFKLMTETAKALGANEHTSKNELKEVLDFEIRLINITLEHWKEENDTYCTIQELKDKIPQFDWMKFFKPVWNNEILENETVLISDEDYIMNVGSLIANAKKRVLANYMIWKFVEKSFPMLGLDWTPRREKCFDYVYDKFSIILDSIYIRQYLPEDMKKAVLVIATYMEKEYINRIYETDWIDEESSTYSVKKVNGTKLRIGFPKQFLNDTFLSDMYSKVTYNNENFFNNNLKRKKWRKTVFQEWINKTFSQREAGSEEIWKPYYHAITSSASIDLVMNIVDISASALQDYMFNKDRPKYLNFGTIGFIYGHELMHAFDGRIVQYSSEYEGREVENRWSNETNKHFKTKTGCFLEQYAKYTVRNGMKVNATKTHFDNKADNLGYELAYLAYQSWVKDNGREPMLPGLKYTQNQLFWISAASVMCTKMSLDSEVKALKAVHSLPQFRVIGSMSNIPEFSKDFNCPPDSAMNPRKKCRVWRHN